MKKLYIITLIFITTISHAQIVDIPDVNFKYALVNTNCVDTNGDGYEDSDADTNDDGEIQVSEAEAVLWLKVFNDDIASLEGIGSFINLEYLQCEHNQLTELDFSNNTKLKTLRCDNNQLTSLVISNCPLLEFVRCPSNELSNLDISQNFNLKHLDIILNQFVNIDVTNNPNLEFLACASNQLTSIDVTQNPLLNWLDCSNNPLSNIDVTNNPNLVRLFCGSNQLTSLNVTQNPLLTRIGCSNNQIPSLNVSQNLNLSWLNCDGNNLLTLDFSQNPLLTWLTCTNTQLTSLNISNGNNSNLYTFWTFDNPNLYCIQVDDENATVPYCAPWDGGWCKDDWAEYSEECILGLVDNEINSFTLYPNPTQNILFIETQQPIERVKIYNLQGKLLIEDFSKRIDVSNLNSGLYFIQVSVNGKRAMKKFVKE